jgi:hypothetical protein
MRFPLRQFRSVDRKAYMDWSDSIVRWDCSSREFRRLFGCAADKQEQKMSGLDIHRTKSIVFYQGFEAKHLSIESYCSWKIVDV